MIKMRTLFNTLCHMLQRILESIKIVFADNRVSHFLCVASIEARTFIMQFYLMKRVVTYGFKIYPISKIIRTR